MFYANQLFHLRNNKNKNYIWKYLETFDFNKLY